MPIVRRLVELKVNKYLYLCHSLVLSSPTLMMHGHMNLKVTLHQRVMDRVYVLLCEKHQIGFVHQPPALAHHHQNGHLLSRPAANVEVEYDHP